MTWGFTGFCGAPYKNTDMRLQTLVATIDQKDHSLVDKLNIQTDAIIGNQCDRTGTEIIERQGHCVTYLNDTDRGVGVNRNRLLDHAEADFLIMADDDMRFVDGYPEIVEQAISACTDADVYIFNLIEQEQRRYVNQKIARVGRRNFARYGTARLMLRRESVERAGIRFSLEFGGGARFGSGEDTIFLRDCLDHGLKLYAIPLALAEIDQQAQSSWFNGYNHKFFFDKGALYCALHPRLKKLYCLRYVICYREKYVKQYRMLDALHAMYEGIEAYRSNEH